MKISETLKEKSRLGIRNFRRIITPRKSPTVVVQFIKNPAWAIEKQPVEREVNTPFIFDVFAQNVETVTQPWVTQIP